MKYSKIYSIGERLHYTCAPDLPPKDDGGNFCLTLFLDDVGLWNKTVKGYPVRKEDVPNFKKWIDENNINNKQNLGLLDGVNIPFSEIEIINVEGKEYAILKLV